MTAGVLTSFKIVKWNFVEEFKCPKMSVVVTEVVFGCTRANMVEQKGKWPCTQHTEEKKAQLDFVQKFMRIRSCSLFDAPAVHSVIGVSLSLEPGSGTASHPLP